MQDARLKEKSALKRRESNYDLLRILSAVAVITIHVSGSYLDAGRDASKFGDYYTLHTLTSCLYNVLSRFATPCFLMLSGAFVLADDRNADYRCFYRKSLKKIGMPTLVFTILYFLYNSAFAVYDVAANRAGFGRLLSPIKAVITGSPFYHMWYLYMFIGLYIITPLVIRFKNSIEERTFQKIVGVFFLLAIVSGWTSEWMLAYDIGFQLYHLGYFMLGYLLRKWATSRKNNFKGVCLILSGLLIELFAVYLQYTQLWERLIDPEWNLELVGPMNPLIAAASVLLFAGFSLLEVRRDFSKLSAYTLLIYLFHAGIWDVCVRMMRALGTPGDNRIMIPAGICVVFVVSYLLSMLYQHIWQRAEAKFGLADRLCRWMHLA